MNLSPNFTLAELTVSDWAERTGTNNQPPPDLIPNLKLLAAKLEEVRTLLGFPIRISSAYRSMKVNKAAGSHAGSKHILGLAADLKCPKFGDPIAVCNAIVNSKLQFGKVILEYYNPATGGGWVHLQLGDQRTAWTINRHGTFAGIRP